MTLQKWRNCSKSIARGSGSPSMRNWNKSCLLGNSILRMCATCEKQGHMSNRERSGDTPVWNTVALKRGTIRKSSPKRKVLIMQLDDSLRYTSCMLRLYEEDFNELEILMLCQKLKDNGFNRLLCCRHEKQGSKTHYHFLCICDKQFRPSFLYKMDILPHWCSDCLNRREAYFYIKFHKGKEKEDSDNSHAIFTLWDTVNYKYCYTPCKKNDLRGFFECVDDLLKENPHITKKALLYALMKENVSYMGYYLKHYQFVDRFQEHAVMDLSKIYVHKDEEEY